MPVTKSSSAGSGAFLTQHGEKGDKNADLKKDINDLEHLLANTNQTSQSTQLLKKRKEMKEVDNALELMKDDYKRRMDECEERRIAFESKQAKMRDQVLKFEKFIQENDAKRLRAETKAKAERKLFMEKVDEINILSSQIDELNRTELELKADLHRRSYYREYLESVVETSDMAYEEIADVLNRHNVLTKANAELADMAENQDAITDEFRRKLNQATTEAQNVELTSNSLLQRRQKDLELMIEKTKKVESEKNVGLEKVKSVQQEWGGVETAIKNIFNRCVSTMRNQPLFPPKADAPILEVLQYDLEVIGQRIEDLIDITRDFSNGVSYGDSLAEGSMTSVQTGVTGMTGVTGQLASKSVVSTGSHGIA
jgi:hypothetical protein